MFRFSSVKDMDPLEGVQKEGGNRLIHAQRQFFSRKYVLKKNMCRWKMWMHSILEKWLKENGSNIFKYLLFSCRLFVKMCVRRTERQGRQVKSERWRRNRAGPPTQPWKFLKVTWMLYSIKIGLWHGSYEQIYAPGRFPKIVTNMHPCRKWSQLHN